MKTYSKQELQKNGEAIAKVNGVDKLFATSDGQFFLPNKANAAKLHKMQNKVELYELSFVVEQVATDDNSIKKTAQERIDEIKSMEDIALIENTLQNETAKTVIKAGKDRIAEIKAIQSEDERNK